MIRKIFVIVFILLLGLMFVGCGEKALPINVYFKNGTAVDSEKNVLNIVYLADKRVENFYTDILVKSNEDNLEIYLGSEGEEKINLYIDEPFQWYSLESLMSASSGKEKIFEKFKDKQSESYIFTTNKKAKLTFVCVLGDLNVETNSLINMHNSSNEFKFEIKNV